MEQWGCEYYVMIDAYFQQIYFEQFSPGFEIVYTNYCVDSFEHLHLDHSSTARFFGGRDIYINRQYWI